MYDRYVDMKITTKSINYSRQKRRKRLIFKRIRFVFILLFAFFTVWCVKNYVTLDKPVGKAEPLNKESTKGISMNKEQESTGGIQTGANITNKVNSQNTELIKKELEEYIKNFQGKYGIYYYNLESGDEFGINHEDAYSAASTIKIPLNLYLYEKIKSGSADPLGTLAYLKQDNEDGTGIIQYEEFGKKYTLKELSRLSIVYSDNVAANMLIRYLGLSNIKEFMQENGGVFVQEGENVSSPRDMGVYMKKVYEFYKANGELGKELMDSFLNTEFNDRLPALLPPGTKVAHKIGTQVRAFHDVGIVLGENPYVISIMSKDIDEDKAPDVIANISKKVYDITNRG